MGFEIDSQTRRDLCVVESYGSEEESLEALFRNALCSRGGRRLLHGWLTEPLTDREAIRDRQQAIRDSGRLSLQIDGEELDFMEYYLEREGAPEHGSRLRSFERRFLRPGSRNERYIIARGVRLIFDLLQALHRLGSTFGREPSRLLDRHFRFIEEGCRILNEEGMAPLETASDALSYRQVDRCDLLFRRRERVVVRGILDIVYQFDLFRAVHFVAGQRSFGWAEFTGDGSGIRIEGLFHPAVARPVSNDWELNAGEHICFFTGSNMAGKSTFLKALSIAVLLAHTGFPVPAASMRLPLFDGLFTTINLPDSLRLGLSHFYAEVLRIKTIVERVKGGGRYFVLFDELFRGTNVRDAYDASRALLELFRNQTNSFFVVSSHMIDLAREMQGVSGIRFCNLHSRIENDEFICTYRLEEGISEAQVGLWLIRREGILS